VSSPFLKKTWSRSRSSNSSLSEFRKAPADTAGRYWIQACCVLSPLSNKRNGNKDGLSGSTPLEFVQYPAHLLLRKLQDKVPIILRVRENCSPRRVGKCYAAWAQLAASTPQR
jgi:hypothetical protein